MKSEAGSKIREYREKKEYPLKYVAKKIGVSLNYISLIERGLRVPCDNILYKLSEVLEVNVVEIFSLYNKVPPTYLNGKSLFEIVCRIEKDDKLDEKDRESIFDMISKQYEDLVKEKESEENE